MMMRSFRHAQAAVPAADELSQNIHESARHAGEGIKEGAEQGSDVVNAGAKHVARKVR
jgi:hypothetical protein